MPKYQNTSKSESIRHGSIAPHRPHSKKDEQEFGLAQKDYMICETCQSVYFEKAWHHSLDEDIKHLTDKKIEKAKIKFKTCPACQMKKDKTFEGELIIRMSGANPTIRQNVMSLLKNSDVQAMEKDPMDRILWTEIKGNDTHVYTSENQLVVRIGKKLESAFKGSTLDISHSKEEDLIRATWEY